MATSFASRALDTDPLRNFKFNVFIGLQDFGSINVSGQSYTQQNWLRLGFMNVSGLGMAIEPLTYREGGDNLTVRKLPGQGDFNPVTLSRGLFPSDPDNWAWMNLIFSAIYGGGPIANGASATQGPDFRTVMHINVLEHPNTTPNALTGGNSGTPSSASYGSPATSFNNQSIIKMSFKLYSAWIGSIAFSDMDAGGNAVGVEQLTINYEGFDVNYGFDGYVPFNW